MVKSEVKPLCLRPYNEARECLFQTDGQIQACYKYLHEYSYCHNNKESVYKRLFNKIS